MWPFRLGGNGFTCATYFAYSGAARDSTTISRNRPSAASAMRLRRSRRPASAHGFRPTTAEVELGADLGLLEQGGHADYESQSLSMRMYHCGFHR